MPVDQFILKHYGSKPNEELAKEVNKIYGTDYDGESLRSKRKRLLYRKNHPTAEVKMSRKSPKEMVARDIESSRAKRDTSALKRKYEHALSEIESLREVVEAVEQMADTKPIKIEPKENAGVSEATIVVLASDWHIEERVASNTVNGKNEYNLTVARKRVEEFFQGVHKLSKILNRDVKIDTMILALLGDFISGDIHDELLENSELGPTEAILEAKNMIASGIEFLLKHTPYKLKIPCHSGNHARTTDESRHATEAEHSLEYIMYHFLADHFKGNPRVEFYIPKSYHSYVQVYGWKLRFSHGHAIRFGGGVGGPTIPINKAIANWNTMEWADIDCFGHLHQRLDGENFVMNGSIIGYNAYAIRIKAKYQKPSQTMFLVDKKRGKTAVWPVVFTV